MQARPSFPAVLLPPLLWGTAATCGLSFVLALPAWRDPASRQSVIVLAFVTFLCLVAALAPPRVRAVLATIVGLGGMAFWVLHDPPLILRRFDEWRILVLFASLILVPAGVVDRVRRPGSDQGALAVTVGVTGILLLWFVPVAGESLISAVTESLDDTSRLTWPQTAVLLWFLVPPLAGATTLLCWRPGRSRRTLLVAAMILAFWMGTLQMLFDLIFIAQVYGWDAVLRQPFAVLLPLQLILYGALAALAPTEVARGVGA